MGTDDLGSPLCVALDTSDPAELERLANATEPYVGMFKFGLTAIYGIGLEMVGKLAPRRPVFLDAKLHDIPAQVDGAVRAIAEVGADAVTVHATGGFEMVRAAAYASGDSLDILAVTILTSFDERGLARVGITESIPDAALRLADLALDAGADGLVCSPHEVAVLRERFGTRSRGGPLLVVPGVRPAGEDADDQKRTMTPKDAVGAGADLLVIGRPITAADDPAAAARSILDEITK
jgi:orotidine-5'-phosphate decarboxylase